MQAKPVTSSLRYPRLAALAFLLAVTLVTLAATFGILWLFVPDVASRTVERAVELAFGLAEDVRSAVLWLRSAI
ncbi:hypothetical protein C5C17_10705 [Pseudoclavibacter sp. RFBA6]|nr:hypothetical protein C5C17_10705 [Pseudoclavibacter sp. RFBA6]